MLAHTSLLTGIIRTALGRSLLDLSMHNALAGRSLGRAVRTWLPLLLFTAHASAQLKQPAPPTKARVDVPGVAAVAKSSNLPAPPKVIRRGTSVSRTWTEILPDGRRTTHTFASADPGSPALPMDFDSRVLLRYAQFDPVEAQPEVPPLLHAGPDTNIYIGQFTGAIIPGMLDDLALAGATPRAFLPNFAYIATIPAQALIAVRALECVRAVVPYHPAYRLDDELVPKLFSFHNNSLPPDSGEGASYNIQTLVPGPALKGDLVKTIESVGGLVENVTEAGALVRATLTTPQLRAVLRSDSVLFVDRASEPSGDMNIIRSVVGADFVYAELGFLGDGVRAMVVDDNVRQSHSAFQSPPPELLTGVSGDTSHGTCCYGILFGTGAGFSPGRGLLPAAEQGYFADYDAMDDRVALSVIAGSDLFPFRCVVQSNSWGHSWTTTYTTISAEMDLAAFASGLFITQSQSNTGSQASRPEAWAKNVVAVGGIAHQDTAGTQDDCYCGYASTGPAADGRVKPDLALHNDAILTTAYWSDLGYTSSFGGTSAASAGVAGVAGLVYQMWHEGVFAGFGGLGGGEDVFASRPAAATVRALLVNTAFRYDVGGPAAINRFRQGWGVPRLERLYKIRQGMLIVDQSIPVQVGQAVDFPFIVPPNAAELSASMAYRDVPGTTSSTVHRVNDITLLAVSPSGIEYWGNAGLTAGNTSVPGGVPDTRNVIENVFLFDPEPGIWTIRVFAAEVNADSRPETPELDADFSLVIANRVVNYCEADWNRDDIVNSTDVSDFINAWFNDLAFGTRETDVDQNGIINSTDVSSFINSYFDGIAGGCG